MAVGQILWMHYLQPHQGICVTGLTTVTTAIYWSRFGQIIILVLIQLGGLGVMTAASIVALIINKKISIQDRLYLSAERNTQSMAGIVKIVKYVIGNNFPI